jgi:hypothetical protein
MESGQNLNPLIISLFQIHDKIVPPFRRRNFCHEFPAFVASIPIPARATKTAPSPAAGRKVEHSNSTAEGNAILSAKTPARMPLRNASAARWCHSPVVAAPQQVQHTLLRSGHHCCGAP